MIREALATIGKREALRVSKRKTFGIIAEDQSDFDAIQILIRRILKSNNVGFKKSLGGGCARIRNKADKYARNLTERGCQVIIIVHDLDKRNHDSLKNDIDRKIKGINNYFICIPIEELEAWFLSDEECIKNIFNLKKRPKPINNPESIPSPKEFLGNIVSRCSNDEKIYLNTKHNKKLAEGVSIDTIKRKCNSFSLFHSFIDELRA